MAGQTPARKIVGESKSLLVASTYGNCGTCTRAIPFRIGDADGVPFPCTVRLESTADDNPKLLHADVGFAEVDWVQVAEGMFGAVGGIRSEGDLRAVPGRDYGVEMHLDLATGTFCALVDGRFVADNAPVRARKAPERLLVGTSHGTRVVVDNIELRRHDSCIERNLGSRLPVGATGEVRLAPECFVPMLSHGPPCVRDLDGDGQVEILAAGGKMPGVLEFRRFPRPGVPVAGQPFRAEEIASDPLLTLAGEADGVVAAAGVGREARVPAGQDRATDKSMVLVRIQQSSGYERVFSRLFAASEPLGLVPLRLGGARTGFALPFGPYLQRYEIHERRAGGEELYAELGRVEFLPEAPGQDPPPWPWLGFADTDGDGQNELLVTWDNCGALALATETACERR